MENQIKMQKTTELQKAVSSKIINQGNIPNRSPENFQVATFSNTNG